MIQMIRAAGGDLLCLHHPQTKAALEFIREFWPYVSPKSSIADYQTIIGFLLADSVYLAPNWPYSISVIHKAGRGEDFETYPGVSWTEESRPSNLLGGELLALPKNAQHREKAIQLMRFLMEKEVQERLVTDLLWPPMRLDALGKTQDWQLRHQIAIGEALKYAESTPDYWSEEMDDVYRKVFHEMISSDRAANIQSTLEGFQEEIDALGIGGCQ